MLTVWFVPGPGAGVTVQPAPLHPLNIDPGRMVGPETSRLLSSDVRFACTDVSVEPASVASVTERDSEFSRSKVPALHVAVWLRWSVHGLMVMFVTTV